MDFVDTEQVDFDAGVSRATMGNTGGRLWSMERQTASCHYQLVEVTGPMERPQSTIPISFVDVVHVPEQPARDLHRRMNGRP